MWIVFSMVVPPLIAAGVTGIQAYRIAAYDGDEEEYGVDLSFERQLAKVLVNSLACTVSIVSLLLVLR